MNSDTTSKDFLAPISSSSQNHEDEPTEFQELKKLVKANKESIEPENIDSEREAISQQTIKERETHRRGEEEYYGLRRRWSWFIFSFVSFMLVFQLVLTTAIGFKIVDFTSYPIFLNLIIGENFAQIIGMGVIVSKFLFPNYPKR